MSRDSHAPRDARTSVAAIAARKGGTPLTMVTAYDVRSAAWCDAAGVDLLLVGDSAATVVLGLPDTSAMPLALSVAFTAAVARGSRRAIVVGDLPAGSYEASDAQAVASARQLIDAGAQLVKLEGAGAMRDRVAALVAAGIPAVGHLGLLPQRAAGDYRARARHADEAQQLVQDALALAGAGASLLVLEAIPAAVAAAVTARLSIPTIGIGAGADCDGQVIVLPDLIGLTEPPLPRFVERYATLGDAMRDAVARWAADVQARRYPAERHTYGMPEAERARFVRSDQPDRDR